MKDFQESDRLNYDLSADSIIVEVGGFEGWFAGELWNKFGARMYVYEPVLRFREKCEARFKENDKISILPYALGGSDGVAPVGIKGDMTGVFCGTEETEDVNVLDAHDALLSITPNGVDLLCLNCEGSEYTILERLLDTGFISRIRNISVQFHTVVPDYQQRMERIIERLKETHDHVYGSPFIWDGFTLKK